MRVSNIKIIEDDIDTISCSGDDISGGHPQIFLKVSSEDGTVDVIIAVRTLYKNQCLRKNNMFEDRISVKEVEEGNKLSPKFNSDGFIPVVTTDTKTGILLMHAFMNAEALNSQLKKERLIIIVEAENVYGIKEPPVALYKRLIIY